MKIKNLLCLALILGVSCATAAETATGEDFQKSTIHLASAQVLQREITAVVGTPYFAEKTKLHEQLSDKELYPEKVELAVQSSIKDYLKYLISSGMSAPVLKMMEFMIQNQRDAIIQAILNAKE